MRENRGTTSNTKEDRAGEGRQGHVELREHPGLGGAAAGGAGLGGPLRGLVALDFDQHRLIFRRTFATPLLFQKKRRRKKKKTS